MTIITLKQGDTRRALRAKLKTLDGRLIDLTSASVLFKLADRGGRVVLNREATVLPNGAVEFVFNYGETDISGLFSLEYEVTYADMRVETFPHSGVIPIYIEKRIGGV